MRAKCEYCAPRREAVGYGCTWVVVGPRMGRGGEGGVERVRRRWLSGRAVERRTGAAGRSSGWREKEMGGIE